MLQEAPACQHLSQLPAMASPLPVRALPLILMLLTVLALGTAGLPSLAGCGEGRRGAFQGLQSRAGLAIWRVGAGDGSDQASVTEPRAPSWSSSKPKRQRGARDWGKVGRCPLLTPRIWPLGEDPASAAQACHLAATQAKACVLWHRRGGLHP